MEARPRRLDDYTESQGFDKSSLFGTKIIDKLQWKRDVVDLHKVMDACHALYLFLEQYNEALLRVGLEIVTCGRSRKAVYWNEGWWPDEERREWFKRVVGDKLKIALSNAAGAVVQQTEELDEGVSDAEFAAMQKRMASLQEQLDAEKQAKKMLEMDLKRVNGELSEKDERLAENEQVLSQLRSQLRAAQNQEPADNSELEAIKAKLQAAEQEKNGMKMKMGDLEKKVANMVSKADLEKALAKAAEFEKQMAEQQKENERLKKEAELNSKNKGASARATDSSKAVPTGADPEMAKRLQEALAAAEAARKRAQELEAAEQAAQEKLKATEAQLQQERDRVHQISAQLKAALESGAGAGSGQGPTAEAEPATDSGRPNGGSNDAELRRELARLKKENAELQETMAKKDQTIQNQKAALQTLKEEKAELEAKVYRTLKMLNELREQLKKVREIAERKGYGNLIDDILAESGLGAKLNDPEWTVFDKLYEDAKRRQEKMRQLMADRFGIGEKSADESPERSMPKLARGYAPFAGARMAVRWHQKAKSRSQTDEGEPHTSSGESDGEFTLQPGQICPTCGRMWNGSDASRPPSRGTSPNPQPNIGRKLTTIKSSSTPDDQVTTFGGVHTKSLSSMDLGQSGAFQSSIADFAQPSIAELQPNRRQSEHDQVKLSTMRSERIGLKSQMSISSQSTMWTERGNSRSPSTDNRNPFASTLGGTIGTSPFASTLGGTIGTSPMSSLASRSVDNRPPISSLSGTSPLGISTWKSMENHPSPAESPQITSTMSGANLSAWKSVENRPLTSSLDGLAMRPVDNRPFTSAVDSHPLASAMNVTPKTGPALRSSKSDSNLQKRPGSGELPALNPSPKFGDGSMLATIDAHFHNRTISDSIGMSQSAGARGLRSRGRMLARNGWFGTGQTPVGSLSNPPMFKSQRTLISFDEEKSPPFPTPAPQPVISKLHTGHRRSSHLEGPNWQLPMGS